MRIKVKYLDASALVKLYLDEEGSNYYRDYFYKNTNFFTVQMTFYEAMNVLKARLFTKDKEKYRRSIEDLTINYWSKEQTGKMVIEEIELNNYKIFLEISEMVWKYNIDFADAIQIYAIMKGKYSYFTLDSKSVLITADDKLEVAAKDNQIRVWNCRKSGKPEWLDN